MAGVKTFFKVFCKDDDGGDEQVNAPKEPKEKSHFLKNFEVIN
jgi:hypothetical protein